MRREHDLQTTIHCSMQPVKGASMKLILYCNPPSHAPCSWRCAEFTVYVICLAYSPSERLALSAWISTLCWYVTT